MEEVEGLGTKYNCGKQFKSMLILFQRSVINCFPVAGMSWSQHYLKVPS